MSGASSETASPGSDPPAPLVIELESAPTQPAPLPLHRLASSALVGAALAGPAGAAAFLASVALLPHGRMAPSTAVLSVLVIGACTAFFVGCVGLLLRAPPRVRLVLLATAGLTIFLFGAAVAGWADGLVRGGTERAWRDMVREMNRVLEDKAAWSLILAPAAPFVLMGGLRAGLVPSLGWPPGPRWQALSGGLSGVAFTLILWTAPNAGGEFGMLAVFVATGLAIGAALGHADRLEPRFAAALRRRVVGE